jgi:CDP-6-deoxy-D-xylo-4-hexulose-3-dehydrase
LKINLKSIHSKINFLLKKELNPLLSKSVFSKYKYPLSQPIFNDKEISSAIESLINLNISSGKKVKNFEKNFAKYIGCKYAIAVNSGSSANLIALAALMERYSLKRGDEVIIPASTFATVAMPIAQLGLIPVFADVNLSDFNISVKSIIKLINKKTKIIMPVHTLGYPADMEEILNIAKKKNIIVFEDCCEAHGSKIKSKKLGSFGNISAFSFFVAHNMTTGEGGMILTNDKKLFNICSSIREFGRLQYTDRGIKNRFYNGKILKNYDKKYVFDRLGYNMRMTDVSASLGIEQLKKLDFFNIIRRKNAEWISINIIKKFKKYFIPLKINNNYFHTYYTYPFLINNKSGLSRKDICVHLEKSGIETRPLFGGCLPDQPAFLNLKFKKDNLSNSRILRDNVFFVGVHPRINKNHLLLLKNSINNFLNK